ncbi:MAG: 3-coathanger stack domain-containing protein [Bacteroidota bacterium]
MTYFTKIAQYFAGELNEVERLVFEQELAYNPVLQKEVAAYELAQDLFGKTAASLSEVEITTSAPRETADELIDFVASNLSEEEIVGKPVARKSAVVRSLPRRSRRTTWLAAASAALILGFIGWNWQEKIIPPVTPNIVSSEQKNNANNQANPKIAVPSTNSQVVAVDKMSPIPKPAINEDNSSKYEPAKKRITPKSINKAATIDPSALLAINEITTTGNFSKKTNQEIEKRTKENNSLFTKTSVKDSPNIPIASQASLRPASNTLVVDQKIEGAQKVIFQADESITLTAGFQVGAGTEFTAKATEEIDQGKVSVNTVVQAQEQMQLQAEKTIVLKAGFHVKAGGSFSATIGQSR